MELKGGRLLLFAVLALIAAPVPVGSQNNANSTAERALAPCVQSCDSDILPRYACSTSQQCFCKDNTLIAALTACIKESCPVEDAIEAKKFQADTCNYPEHSLVMTATAVCWALFAVAILFSIFRAVSRSKVWGGAGFWWDDWTLFLCLLPMIAATATAYAAYQDGMGRDYWEVGVTGIRESMKLFFIGQPLYIAVVFGTKISLVLLYLRIFLTDSRPLRAICWVVIVALTMCLVAFEFATIFQCSPISYNWTEFLGTGGSCIDRRAQVYSVAAINIFFDVVVIFIPIRHILKLRISWEKKLGVCSVFLVGVVVIACSCVRLQYLARFGTNDNVTYNYTYIAIWSLIEVHLSVVCVCMPATAGLAYRTYKFARGEKIATMNRPSTKERDEKRLMGVAGAGTEEGRILAANAQARGLGIEDSADVESGKSSGDDQRGFYFDGKFFVEGQSQGEASDSLQMQTLKNDKPQKPIEAHLRATSALASGKGPISQLMAEAARQRPSSPEGRSVSRGRSRPSKDTDQTATAAAEDAASSAGSGNGSGNSDGSKACADANQDLAAIRAEMSLNPTRNPTETSTEFTSNTTSMGTSHDTSELTSTTMSPRDSSLNKGGVPVPHSGQESSENVDRPSTAKAEHDHPLRAQGLSMPNSRPTTPQGHDQGNAQNTRSASSSLFSSRRASAEFAQQALANANHRGGQQQARPNEATRSASSSLFNSNVPSRRPSSADGVRLSNNTDHSSRAASASSARSRDLRPARYARSYVAYYERPSPMPIQPANSRESDEPVEEKRNQDFQAILEAKRQLLRSRSNDSSLFSNSQDSMKKPLDLDCGLSVGDQLRTASEQRLAVDAATAALGVDLDMPFDHDDGVPLGEEETGPWPDVPMGDTEPGTDETSVSISPLEDTTPDDVSRRRFTHPPSPGVPGHSNHPLEVMRTSQPPFSRTSTGNGSNQLKAQSRALSEEEHKRNSDQDRAIEILNEMRRSQEMDGDQQPNYERVNDEHVWRDAHRNGQQVPNSWPPDQKRHDDRVMNDEHRRQWEDTSDDMERRQEDRPPLSRAPSLRTQMRGIQQPTFDRQVQDSYNNLQAPPSMRDHFRPSEHEAQPASLVQQNMEQLRNHPPERSANGERRSGDSGGSGDSGASHDSAYSSAESGELDVPEKQKQDMNAQYPPSSPTSATYTTAEEDQSSVHPLQDYHSEGNPYEASKLRDDLMDIPSRVTAVVVDAPTGRYELRRTLTDVSFDKPSAEELAAVTPQEGWRHQVGGQSYFPDPDNMAASTAAMIDRIPDDRWREANGPAWKSTSTEETANQAAEAGSWHNSAGMSRTMTVEEINANRWRSFKPQAAHSRGSSAHSFFRRPEEDRPNGQSRSRSRGFYDQPGNNSSQSFRPHYEGQFSPRRPASWYSQGSNTNYNFGPEERFPRRQDSNYSFRWHPEEQFYRRQDSYYSSRDQSRDPFPQRQNSYYSFRSQQDEPWNRRQYSYNSFRPRQDDVFPRRQESYNSSHPWQDEPYQRRQDSNYNFRPQYAGDSSPARTDSNYNFRPPPEEQFSPRRPQQSRQPSHWSDVSFKNWHTQHHYDPDARHPTERAISNLAQHELWNNRNPTEFSRDGTEPSQAVNLERKSDERLYAMDHELPKPEAIEYSPSPYQDSPSPRYEDPGSPGISVPTEHHAANGRHVGPPPAEFDRIDHVRQQQQRQRANTQSSSRQDNDTMSEASTQKWNPVSMKQKSGEEIRAEADDNRDSWLQDQENRRQAAKDLASESEKASRYSGIYAYDPPTAEMVSAIASDSNEYGIDQPKPPGFWNKVTTKRTSSAEESGSKWDPVSSPQNAGSRHQVPQVKDKEEDLPLRADPKDPKISSFQQHRSSQGTRPASSRRSTGSTVKGEQRLTAADDRYKQAQDVDAYLSGKYGNATGDASRGAQRHLMAYQDQMDDNPAARFAQSNVGSTPTTALKGYPLGSPDVKKPYRDPQAAAKIHAPLTAQSMTSNDHGDSPLIKSFPARLISESSEDSTYSSTDMSSAGESDTSPSPSPSNSLDATSTIPRFRQNAGQQYRFGALEGSSGADQDHKDVPRYVPTEEDNKRREKAHELARQIIRQSRDQEHDEFEPYRRPSTADGDHSARPSPPKNFEAYRSDSPSRRQRASGHVDAVSKRVGAKSSVVSQSSDGSSGSEPLSDWDFKGIGQKHGPSNIDVRARPGMKGRELRMSWQG